MESNVSVQQRMSSRYAYNLCVLSEYILMCQSGFQGSFFKVFH